MEKLPRHGASYEEPINQIFELLKERPQGLSEFELLTLLRECNMPVFAESGLDEPLNLFRTHFLLFHLLYRLREHLRKSGTGDLDIHCLRILLLPPSREFAHDEILPGIPDKLREYYLNLKNLHETERDEVDAMLRGFWSKYERCKTRPAALTTFGLETEATPEDIRRRYRELVMTHHPDRGGDAERFHAVIEAAAILLPDQDRN
ncbi:MAG: DnaJ domain-containing protein [Candidatus Riflebacteria bacterium]|nr:DnaJ domain-containing protein [Candidatus Riflebacteria bacterium]